MVYCGPPSKGCSNCRDRKIRCDQREPGCGQCEKRQQQCPGYRNMVDLMFRDESSHVIKKAKAKQRRKVTASRTPEPGPSPNGDISPAILPSSSSTTTLALPTETTLPSPPVKLETRPKGLTLLTPGPSNGTSIAGTESSGSSTPLPLNFIMQPDSLFQHHQQAPVEALQTQAPQEYQSHQEKQKELVWTRDESTLPSPDAGSWPATPLIARMYNIDPSCQERGTAFFFSRYVTMAENASHQRFDFLYDIWKPGSLTADRQLDGVMASMTAVGLVGISQLTHSEEIIDSARKSYGTALCLTNEALRDEGEALKDTTMLSILILGVYEMMAEPGMKTMTTWQDHINGAVILAKLRGVSQFQTRAGVRMFKMLCESVIISCMQRKVPMPEELVALQDALYANQTQKHEPGSFNSVDWSKPVYLVLQARHDMMKMGLMDNLDALLERMDAIEVEFERAVSAFPADCRYKELKVTRPHKAVFRDSCHIYSSITTASVWNWLRTGRIMVLETAMSAIQKHFPDPGEQGEHVPPRYKAAFQQVRRKLELVNSSVVASVPQHFGLLNPVNPYFDSLRPMPPTAVPISTIEVREPPTPPVQSPMSSAGSVQTPSTHSEDRSEGGYGFREAEDVVWDDGGPGLDNPARSKSAEEEAERYMLLASATNAVVWPLFCVGLSSVCTPQLKAYVISRLMAIFDETGLKQARSAASIVRNRELVKSPWSEAPHRTSKQTSMAPPPLAAARKPAGSSSSEWQDEVTMR
ncbi:zinc c6 finger domain protein [Ophiostoma piceae UAMH 11346]|uniref:Zinc c6 finger domain protein n=1 Tax=Ophiostoma piceae (strain UAMH 11346) TaxID=1262450 RepID=S3CRL7_OPHP1|nr:zinc c6 finger domain protein [Ophiostoma piceae UAMH 11346]